MSIVITPEQFIYASSFFQDQFSFGSANEEVRTCRYLNNILNMFGRNVVLSDGITTDVSVVANVVSVTISEGVLISDKTLIPFDSFVLDIDITDYLAIGAYVVVYTDFEFTADDRDVVTDPCPFYFKIGIVDSDGLPLASWPLNPYRNSNSVRIDEGSSEAIIDFIIDFVDTDYHISTTLLNVVDLAPSQYLMTVIDKTSLDFTTKLSGNTDTDNYYLTCLAFKEDPDTQSGFESIDLGEDSVTVTIPTPYDDTDYIIAVSILNTTDATVSQYATLVTAKTTSSFTIDLSGKTDTANYVLSWLTTLGETNKSGIEDIEEESYSVTVEFSTPYPNKNYNTVVLLENIVDENPSKYAFTITSKTTDGFTVTFSGLTDTANYKLSWMTYLTKNPIIMCVYDIDNEKCVSEETLPKIAAQDYSLLGLQGNVEYLDLLDGGQL